MLSESFHPNIIYVHDLLSNCKDRTFTSRNWSDIKPMAIFNNNSGKGICLKFSNVAVQTLVEKGRR